MKTFKDGESSQSEYFVLKCPKCKSVFRHDISLGFFGKPMKKRMCIVCGDKVPIDEAHCLDHDPMAGQWSASFQSANEL